MKYTTVNPFNNHLLKEVDFHTYPDLDKSRAAFQKWSKISLAERSRHLSAVADLLEKDLKKYAHLITLEMGKPLREAEYELRKTLTAFDYYITHAPEMLKDQPVKTQASESYIRFAPIGVILSVMPWNFPFWQVFRFAIPTLISGNVTILKHAPNVPQCAAAIEDLFLNAGAPEHIFRNYYLTHDDAGKLIADPAIAGVSFTGSDVTGSEIAGLAGKNLKKCVLELGGNDPFIILADADIESAVASAIKSRSINSGQSCNAAKRFIVVEEAAEEFTKQLITAVSKLKVGDPSVQDTDIGPLARKDLADKVKDQVDRTIRQGAQAVYGMSAPNEDGNFVSPVVLTGVMKGMVAYEEEIFGPVWSVIKVHDTKEAIQAANNSVYGLGASIWTRNVNEARLLINEMESGNVFINDIVKSDPRLPFGGVKRSGFGRELSEYGLKEFVNVQTVYVK